MLDQAYSDLLSKPIQITDQNLECCCRCHGRENSFYLFHFMQAPKSNAITLSDFLQSFRLPMAMTAFALLFTLTFGVSWLGPTHATRRDYDAPVWTHRDPPQYASTEGYANEQVACIDTPEHKKAVCYKLDT